MDKSTETANKSQIGTVAATAESIKTDLKRPEESAALKLISEDFLQESFFENHKGLFRYNSSSKSWMFFEHGIWSSTTSAQVENALREFLRDNLLDLITKYGPASDNDAKLSEAQLKLLARYSGPSGQRAILKMATHVSNNHVSPSNFDPDKHLLNTPTLFVDLKTGERHPHDSKLLMTRRTSVGPSSMAIPVFKSFLHDFTQGDTEMEEFLQRFSGYCLTGETREHKLVFFCGSGGNGKSVLLNVMREVMGSYARMSNSTILMKGAESRHTTEVAELVGTRMVTISEVPSDGMWSQQRLTSLAGGDTLTARFMHQNSFQFDPQFKLVLAGNHRPVVQTPDQAFLRRMLFVNSAFRPETPDVALSDRLREEHGGILQWMIDGAVAYYRDGLTIPVCIADATKDYAADEDDVSQWMEECCITDVDSWVSMQELLANYSEWAEDNGAREYKKRGLTERIAALGYIREKRTLRGYIGLRLRNTGALAERATRWSQPKRALLQ